MNECLNSSEKMDWGTPKSVYDALDEEFGFNIDVCAHELNYKCDNYFSEADDGLSKEWGGVCWMNPPYGRSIGAWIEKAYNESLKGSTVVCLIPSRTDTKYWHNYVMNSAEIRFVERRMKFEDANGKYMHRAPFPCAVVVFRKTDQPPKISGVFYDGQN